MMDFTAAENDYENLELVPPPLFTKQEMPFDYRYGKFKSECVNEIAY
jgi:hypothetical protein